MLVRAIALSLALVDRDRQRSFRWRPNHAEAGPHKHRSIRKTIANTRNIQSAWWRQYHATHAAAKHALQARRRSAASASAASCEGTHERRQRQNRRGRRQSRDRQPTSSAALLPSGEPAPAGWKHGTVDAGRAAVPRGQFDGAQVGSAAISVVGPAMGESVDTRPQPARSAAFRRHRSAAR